MSIFSRIIDWVTTPYTIFLILKDPAVPRGVKIRAIIGLIAIFVYIISPFDIIPDFVPFSGWLDDLAVIPAGFALLRSTTPGIDVKEKQETAQKDVRKVLFWTAIGLAGIAIMGIALFSLVIYAVVRIISG